MTLMMLHDFSQLPVMQGEREVKGVIRWDALGPHIALGKSCVVVRDCMEPHHEVSSEVSLFAALPGIIQHQYVLVRAPDERITGIVTTTDVSLQCRQLAEPFLLLGEIENHIRRLIDGKFTVDEAKAAQDTADSERQVQSVADLTFGEYVWLLGNDERWAKLGIAVDRKLFVSELDTVRRTRNDVMHFDPDGAASEDLAVLQRFVGFLQRLHTFQHDAP